MKELRFAIIGCGRISPRHFESLARIEGAKVVAAVDIVEARYRASSEKYNVKGFSSITDLLAWGEFDVACICTPSGMHAQNAIEVMKAGKSVVVEKPMALKLSDADEMIAVAKEKNTSLFVVKQNRFNLPVQYLRKTYEEGRFGKLLLGTIRVRWSRDQAYYDQDPWRGKWSMDGGVFSNQASHHIDLLEWFFGEVETVFAKTETYLAKIECEDTGVAVLKFKSGALGLIEATTATRPKDLEGSLSILGEKGTAEISGFAVNKIRHFQFKETLPDDVEVAAKFSENPVNVYGFGHLAYLQNVVSTLLGHSLAAVDGVEGRKSLELINALYVSNELKKEINVSENRLQSRLGT